MADGKKRALVVLAEGAEEMEVVVVVDVLRRAGVEVDLAGLDGPGVVTCSRSVRLAPDVALEHCVGPYDAMILPGGAEGATRLGGSERLGHMLRSAEARGEVVGAICAAPLALAKHGVFAGRTMTCHPSVQDLVSTHANLVGRKVVVDGALITAPGPAMAFDFAIALVERVVGMPKANEVARQLLLEG